MRERATGVVYREEHHCFQFNPAFQISFEMTSICHRIFITYSNTNWNMLQCLIGFESSLTKSILSFYLMIQQQQQQQQQQFCNSFFCADNFYVNCWERLKLRKLVWWRNPHQVSDPAAKLWSRTMKWQVLKQRWTRLVFQRWINKTCWSN